MLVGMLRRAFMAVLVAFLQACGGGGGGEAEVRSVSITMKPQHDIKLLERDEHAFLAVVDVKGLRPNQEFFISAGLAGGGNSRLFSESSVVDDYITDSIRININLRTDIPAGHYEETLQVVLCTDERCSRSPFAGPASMKVVVDVSPNIAVQPHLSLTRTGSEAAPSIDLPVIVPPEAGELRLQVVGNDSEAIQAEFLNGVLHVDTRQVRSGTHELLLALVSSNGYSARTRVTYLVEPAAEGERGMSITPQGPLSLSLADGEIVTRRVRLTKASWSSAPVTVELGLAYPEAPSLVSIQPIGGDEYDLVINTRGLALKRYYGSLRFMGPPEVGEVGLDIAIDISSAVRVVQPPVVRLDVDSTMADGRWSSPVEMLDGGRVPWTATVDVPWLRLVRSSGTTSLDVLEAEIVPQELVNYPAPTAAAVVEVTVQRQGVQPVRLFYPLENRLQAITRTAPGALVGTTGRIHLSGMMLSRADLVSSGLLTVSGATLRHSSHVADPRYIGDYYLIALDVEGAVPGTSVSVNLNTPLLQTSVHVPVLAADAPPAASLSLPIAARRPAVWSSRAGAWFFVGNGQVFRYGLAGGRWSLSSLSLAGVIDVEPSPDEEVLLAITPSSLVAMDPGTLAVRWTSSLIAGGYGSESMLDDRPNPLQKALLATADGSLWTATRGKTGVHGTVAAIDLDWTRPTSTFGWRSASYAGGGLGSEAPYGLSGSAGRTTVFMSKGLLKDSRYVYRTSDRRLTQGYADPLLDRLADGVGLLSTSDGGDLLLTSEGQVRSVGGSINLSSLAGAGRTPMGYALSANGKMAVVYSVSLTGDGAAQTASEAQVSIFDLRGMPSVPPLLATLPLSVPVGCSRVRVAGEPCIHQASLTLDAASRMVFVQGPSGAEVVPLEGAWRAHILAAGRIAPTKRLSVPASGRWVFPASAR